MVQDVEARRMLECPWRVLGNLAETYKRGEATNDVRIVYLIKVMKSSA